MASRVIAVRCGIAARQLTDFRTSVSDLPFRWRKTQGQVVFSSEKTDRLTDARASSSFTV